MLKRMAQAVFGRAESDRALTDEEAATRVHTTRGFIERARLEVRDFVEWHDNARVTATEWRLGGELVRRDVHVNILRGDTALGEQGNI